MSWLAGQVNDDTERLFGLAIILGIGFWLSTLEARMDGSIWKRVWCQRCGALPIDDQKKVTVNCPMCKHHEFGERAPDYAVLTEVDRGFLRSIRIATVPA